MKKLIVANWKMNPPSQKEAKELFESVKAGLKDQQTVETVICPPFVYLSMLKGLTLGAQNVFFEERGAYTGAVSPAMLKSLKVKYVIVGHSESRKHFGETNEIVNKKIKKALEAGLLPILCIGEQEGEDKEVILKEQLTDGLKDVPVEEMQNIVVAYEPVWAIGTGKNCSVEEALEAFAVIRKILSSLYNGDIAKAAPLLYGGSVNAENASYYLAERHEVSGLLVGGASLKAAEFVSIVKLATRLM